MRISSSFLKLLTILLIGLKLTGYIDWSWIVVLSPLLLSFAMILIFGLILLGLAMCGVIISVKDNSNE